MVRCEVSGIVTDSDDVDIVVKCINSVGVNRFFWPQYRDDVCWYTVADVLFVIPEPDKVGEKARSDPVSSLGPYSAVCVLCLTLTDN